MSGELLTAYVILTLVFGFALCFATAVVVLKFFRAYFDEPLSWAYIITIVTTAAAILAANVAVGVLVVADNEDAYNLFWLLLMAVWFAILYPKYRTPGLRTWLRNYAAEHDTPTGEFCGFAAQVWRSFVSFLTMLATSFFASALVGVITS